MSNTLLVIGASSDIGKCLIEKIQQNYTKIYATFNSSKKQVDELTANFGDKIVPIHCDLTDKNQIETAVQKIQNDNAVPNHIVHLASLPAEQKRFHQTNLDDFSKSFVCSVESAVEFIKPFINKIGKEQKGKIVITLTSYTKNIPPKFISPYVVSKYALLGLVKSLSAEYAAKGVCVNGISPEMIKTKFLSETSEHVLQMEAEKSPMGRLLTPEDVVPTFEYLLSPASDCVTGQNIAISGVK